MDGEKHLFIRVTETEEFVIDIVGDNGAGFPPEKAKALLSSDDTPPDISKGSHGIGMFNVLRRLRLYYGRRDVMEIVPSEDGQGTEIRLLLPKG